MRKFLLALVAMIFAASGPALAQAAPWRVSETSGDVRIVEGGRIRPATRGAQLSGGSVVTTAQRARAVLVRGLDYVIVSPASRIRVPTAERGGSRSLVQIIAEAGTTMFRIQHRATSHFAVQTPYLAAVVKGTVFTVTVSEAGASVQVTEGAVEVSTADGGAADLVRPGMIATVSAADLQLLNIQGETRRSIRSNGVPAAGAVTVPPSETGNYRGPADSQVTVVALVTEEPIALSEITGGLVEGNAGVDLALADVSDAVRADAAGNADAGNAGNDTSSPDTAGNGGETTTPGNDDDGNNGHGNDDDGDDAGNPGNGGGNDNSGPGSDNGGGNDDGGDDEADGNNGHGNDDDGDDAGNPGNGGGNDNSGPGSDNGGGNDDDGDDEADNNGHGNDDDGDDAGNPGNGGGNDDPDDGDDD